MNFGNLPSVSTERRPSLTATLSPPVVKVPANTSFLCVLRNVDEAPRASELTTEAADIHVARRVDLGKSKTSEIEAAAVIKVELLVLLNDGFGIERGSEVKSALRKASYDSGFGCERQVFENALLGRDSRHPFRHADAQIYNTAKRQLESAAPRDDLSVVQLHRRDASKRNALPAGEGVVIRRTIGLEVVRDFAQHHAIDQNAGTCTSRGLREFGGSDALDLRYDEAARVLGRHGNSEVVEGEGFPLHGGVAVRIAGRSPDEGDIDRERLVAQPFLAADVKDLNEIFGGHVIEFATLLARIDEGAQSHL